MKASGTTNNSSTRAEVDSNSSSTIPTAYSTRIRASATTCVMRAMRLTAEDEVSSGKCLASDHSLSEGLPDHAETEGYNEQQEEREGIAAGVEDGDHDEEYSRRRSSAMGVQVAVVCCAVSDECRTVIARRDIPKFATISMMRKPSRLDK